VKILIVFCFIYKRGLYIMSHLKGYAGGKIRDASHFWTRGADTREALKKELGNSFRIVSIGPAGENRVTFAILLADNYLANYAYRDDRGSCGRSYP